MSIEPSGPDHDLVPPDKSTHGVILLVDDDEAVRGYCRMVLELDGWQVRAADCAEEACRLAAEHGNNVRLLITDVVMPDTNGRELADRLWQTRPDLKVLFLSGFHTDDVIQAGVAAEELHFLSKPFTPSTLLAKLREMLSDGV